jgi:hypothetical protein
MQRFVKNTMVYSGYVGFSIGSLYGAKYGGLTSRHICFNKQNMKNVEIIAEIICLTTVTTSFILLGSTTGGILFLLYPVTIPLYLLNQNKMNEIINLFTGTPKLLLNSER